MRTRHKTPEDEQRAREEAQREIEANRRQEHEAQRKLFSVFKMWKVCPAKACMRGRACRGDVERCVHERWQPLVPPELKAYLQKSFALMAQGWSAKDADAAVTAELARHEAAAAARARAPKPAPPVPEPIKMPPRVRKRTLGPRIRSLS